MYVLYNKGWVDKGLGDKALAGGGIKSNLLPAKPAKAGYQRPQSVFTLLTNRLALFSTYVWVLCARWAAARPPHAHA